MFRPPIPLDVYEETIPKGKVQDHTQTATEPQWIRSTSYNKEANKRPSRGGKNHESIKKYVRVTRTMHQEKPRAGKTN